MEVFATMTPHQEHNEFLEGYQTEHTQRVLADLIEHFLNSSLGLHSLVPSCQTMSWAMLIFRKFNPLKGTAMCNCRYVISSI